MIRIALAFLLLWSFPLQAQQLDIPDVSQLRQMDGIDVARPVPEAAGRALAATLDPAFFTAGPVNSRITRELAKNLLLNAERGLERKAMEIATARAIADAFSPEEILSMHMQLAYYGTTCYGLWAASEAMLGKPLEEAGLSEAFTLTTLLRAPSTHLKDAAAHAAYYAQQLDEVASTPLLTDAELNALRAGPVNIARSARCPFQP